MKPAFHATRRQMLSADGKRFLQSFTITESRLPPRCHKDDWAAACAAKIRDRVKHRPRITVEQIVQDFVIAGLVHTRGEWTEEQIRHLQKMSTDRNFLIRLTRALDTASDCRQLMFDRIDWYLLGNWRTSLIKGQELPGLRHWKPAAIADLLNAQFEFRGNRVPTDRFVAGRIKRLGLEREKPPTVLVRGTKILRSS